MSLDETDLIDMATLPLPGDACGLVLYVIDGDAHDDELKRFRMLVDKLSTYVRYVNSPEFRSEHPGVEPTDVLIRILTVTPPNDAMLEVGKVGPKEGAGQRMTVQFADYEGFLAKGRSTQGRNQSGTRPWWKFW